MYDAKTDAKTQRKIREDLKWLYSQIPETKGCMECISVCDDDALRSVTQTKESIAQLQLALLGPHRQVNREPQDDENERAEQEMQVCVIVVVERHQHRRQHHQARAGNQETNDPLNG